MGYNFFWLKHSFFPIMTVILYSRMDFFFSYLGLFKQGKHSLEKIGFGILMSYEQKNCMSDIALLSILTPARNHIVANSHHAKSSTLHW